MNWRLERTMSRLTPQVDKIGSWQCRARPEFSSHRYGRAELEGKTRSAKALRGPPPFFNISGRCGVALPLRWGVDGHVSLQQMPKRRSIVACISGACEIRFILGTSWVEGGARFSLTFGEEARFWHGPRRSPSERSLQRYRRRIETTGAYALSVGW